MGGGGVLLKVPEWGGGSPRKLGGGPRGREERGFGGEGGLNIYFLGPKVPPSLSGPF